MNKAYSYIRFSTVEQAGGDSLRRQVEITKSYCRLNNLVLDTTLNFQDLGISAFKGGNQEEGSGLKSFLLACSNGDVEKGSTLIVESLDRISRENPYKAMGLFISIIDHCKVVTLENGVENPTIYDSSENSDQMAFKLITATMVMQRAHNESLMKAQRLGAAWANKKDLAKRGVIATVKAPFWLDIVEGVFVENDKAEIVRLIFEKSLGGYGVDSLMRYLNNNGYESPTGKAWGRSTISRILTEKRAIGEYQPMIKRGGKRVPDGDSIPDYYPSVVSEDTFYASLKARKDRSVSKGRKGKLFTNLFTGCLECAECNSSMHFVDKGRKPKGNQYLKCSNSLKSNGCQQGLIRYEDAESILVMLLGFLDREKNFKTVSVNETADQVEVLEGQLINISKKLTGLVELFISDENVPEEVSSKIRELTIEKTGLQEQLNIERGVNAEERNTPDEENYIQNLFSEIISYNNTAERYSKRTKFNQAVKKLIGDKKISVKRTDSTNNIFVFAQYSFLNVVMVDYSKAFFCMDSLPDGYEAEEYIEIDDVKHPVILTVEM